MQRAALSGLCLLGASAGCSVVLEGTGSSSAGPQRDGPPQVASPGGAGGVESGQGGAGGVAPGGSGGAGQIGGSLPGASGGGTMGGIVNGELGGLGMDTPEPQSPCSLAGNFALDFALDVVWQGTSVDGIVPVIDQGQGTLTFVLLGKFHPTAEGVQGTVRVCDTRVPDFTTSAFITERYAARFSEQMWDSIAMPSFSFMAKQTCDGSTCWWESQRIHAQLGTQLDSPASAWPANAANAFWPDHDGDRLPGITAQMLGPGAYNLSGEPYSYPPVHVLLLRRVSSVMLGLRMQLLLLLEQTDCNHLRGVTEEARVDSRAVGCTAETVPTECSGPELAFFDDNLPSWAVSSGTIEGVRMEADATCAAARAAFR